jgi:hypothetical protein
MDSEDVSRETSLHSVCGEMLHPVAVKLFTHSAEIFHPCAEAGWEERALKPLKGFKLPTVNTDDRVLRAIRLRPCAGAEAGVAAMSEAGILREPRLEENRCAKILRLRSG